MKCWEGYKKILNDSRIIIETLLGKIEIIRRGYCWYYAEILESFSEIFSVKLQKKKKKKKKKLSERFWRI